MPKRPDQLQRTKVEAEPSNIELEQVLDSELEGVTAKSARGESVLANFQAETKAAQGAGNAEAGQAAWEAVAQKRAA